MADTIQEPAKRMTAEEYLALPETVLPQELIGGEMRMAPAPTGIHQRIVTRLTVRLGAWVEEHDLGDLLVSPVDVVFSEENVLQPDILFVRHRDRPVIGRGPIRVVPDLVIELLSPTTIGHDLVEKRRIYAAAGVAHYWIVDVEAKTLEALRLRAGTYETVATLSTGESFEPELFPGLSIALADLWP